MKNRTYNKEKILVVFACAAVVTALLLARLAHLMVWDPSYYRERAEALHERERPIKAARGEIIDRNGIVLASNKTVCTVSVIHSQIKEPERVIKVLSKELGIKEEKVRARVEKVSSIERVRSNVEKKKGDRIRSFGLCGVKVDEDYKRYYPFGETASRALGFTGGDNQGIIGLEVRYEDYLKGVDGTILTLTDARGEEIDGAAEKRIEPKAGRKLRISLDYNIQAFCQQAAYKALEEKEADSVIAILMNPKNGEILAMADVPEFDLNEPFKLNCAAQGPLSGKELDARLNRMWRNECVNDTYEPGSIFKIVTSSACLEEGVVKLDDTFFCPGYRTVQDRRIRCHKAGGHGSETFRQGILNSCNPVFIDIGLRLGAGRFYDYFEKFGLLSLTGIDLPGEAGTIMHKREDIGPVELATMSFGQSFQLTPIQVAATACAVVNGGIRVTPHFGMEVLNRDGSVFRKFTCPQGKRILSQKTSGTMRGLLEGVVEEGSGRRAYIEGYEIGGKTATSQTLPRGTDRYISAFLGFAPANDPSVLGLVIIKNPKGVYYGGTIAAPVLRGIFDNILPYLGIKKSNIGQKIKRAG